MMRWLRTLPLVVVALLAVAGAEAADLPKIFDLAVGDPARREKYSTVAPDVIVDTTRGDTITPDIVAARLDGVQVVLIGETHTSRDFHRVQARMIRALQARGRKVIIGLEMFPAPEQPSLDAWNQRLYSEDGFVKLARWYEHWGYNWQLYREIFLHARDNGMPMYAVNGPRDVVAAVRRKGYAGLTDDEKKFLPPAIQYDDADHLTVFKAAIGDGDAAHGMTADAWKSMAASQTTWDGAMAWHSFKALERHPDPKSIVVILVGSGHVIYGVGIERQLKAWFKGGIASIVPVPAQTDDGTAIPQVRSSYANFVWGLPKDDSAPYPRLGISTRSSGPADGQREIIMIEPDSIGARAGFKVKDVLVSLDGHSIVDREVFMRLMSVKEWGDGASFVVKRGEEQVTIPVVFTRTPARTDGGAK
jgi:uncharacterized iron-regulated protein